MSGVRGYVKYNPQPKARHWLERARAVLIENSAELPLMAREVFYRLVSDYGFPKTEKAYNSLVSILARARRASLLNGDGIPFEWIYDGGQSSSVDPATYEGEDDFEEAVKSAAESFRLDRQDGQEQVVELWCEASGWLPLLQGIGDTYSAKVTTGSGYDSTPLRHELASRAVERAARGLVTVVLHVGDFDPSGENMCAVLAEDVGAMVAQRTREPTGTWFAVKRVALIEQQVLDLGVTTAPPKPTDSRMERFVGAHRRLVDHLGSTDISAQLEALTRPQLRELLTAAIEAEIDRPTFDRVLEREAATREELLRRLAA